MLFAVNSLSAGGAERHLVELVRRGMATGRFSADVVCFRSTGTLAGELVGAGTHVRGPWQHHKYDVRVVWTFLRFVSERRPDVIYTLTRPNEMLLAQLARAILGVPTVCGIHTTRLNRLERRLAGRSSAMVAVAESHRRYLLAYARWDPSRTTFIYNGIDQTRFYPSTGPRLPLIPQLAGRRVVGVVAARLVAEKGQHVLLAALPRVLKRHADVAVVFTGVGLHEAALRAQAAKNGISERVFFLGTRPDIDRVLASLDIFVLPSLREAFSMAVLEAMAAGLPVVVTDVGSMRDMVTSACEGYVVPPNDPAALANALDELLSHPVDAQKMGAAGRKRVERDFTLDRMVDEYATLFHQLARTPDQSYEPAVDARH